MSKLITDSEIATMNSTLTTVGNLILIANS
jgi:hypothetical protein